MKQALEDVKNMMEKEDDEVLELSESSLVNDSPTNKLPEISEVKNSAPGEDIIVQADQAAYSLSPTVQQESDNLKKINSGNEQATVSLSGVISEKTAMEATASLKTLIKTVEKKNQDGLSFRNGLLVEDLIKELIKPQISSWLDSNLPGIVKSVVEKEVRKLIPKED